MTDAVQFLLDEMKTVFLILVDHVQGHMVPQVNKTNKKIQEK